MSFTCDKCNSTNSVWVCTNWSDSHAPPTPAASTPVIAPIYKSGFGAVQGNDNLPQIVCHDSGNQSICYLSGMTADYLNNMIRPLKRNEETKQAITLDNTMMCQQEGFNICSGNNCWTIHNPVCTSDKWVSIKDTQLDYDKLEQNTVDFADFSKHGITVHGDPSQGVEPYWQLDSLRGKMHAGRRHSGDLPMSSGEDCNECKWLLARDKQCPQTNLQEYKDCLLHDCDSSLEEIDRCK